MAGNSYEDMQNENCALRAENEALKKQLDEAQAQLDEAQAQLDESQAQRAKLELYSGDLNERLLAAQRANERLNAQMEIVYLIFGGRH